MTRAGRIVYTNDFPIYYGFDAGAVDFPGTLHADVPARLNAALLAGELDLSPVSAFAYLQHASELVLLPDLCIASHGEAVSVVLVSRTPPALLGGRTIVVTDESASGRNLLRILLERRYGIEATIEESSSPLDDAIDGKLPVLLIGDKAIEARMFVEPQFIYDLGALWTEWTRHDMVFAVWAARREYAQSRPEAVDRCVQALRTSYAWGRERPGAVAAAAQAVQARPPHFYERYYDILKYDFDEAARAGLRRYAEELAAIGVIEAVPTIAPEVCGVSRCAS